MVSLLERFLNRFPVLLQFARFAAIGFITAAVDFLVLNILSKLLGISAGWQLGAVNVISFTVAVLHSYIWQRYWTFAAAEDAVGVVKNFVRLVLIGGLGVGSLAIVLLGARGHATALFYLIVLALVFLIEIMFWHFFNLSRNASGAGAPKQFIGFIIVSVIGLLINSLIISFGSTYLGSSRFHIDPDLAKNLAKVAANAISLIWNFIGYKLFVFKK